MKLAEQAEAGEMKKRGKNVGEPEKKWVSKKGKVTYLPSSYH